MLSSAVQGTTGSSCSSSSGLASLTLGWGTGARSIRMGMISAVERTGRGVGGVPTGGSGLVDAGGDAAAGAPRAGIVLLVPQ